MSRLSNLYNAMETLRKEGLTIDDKLEEQVSKLEEDIIKNDILPIVKESIEPALKDVQRELVLVVDYNPNQPISVHLSRRSNVAAELDAKEIRLDDVAEHGSREMANPPKTHAPASGLEICFPDGVVIAEKKATDTMVAAVKK